MKTNCLQIIRNHVILLDCFCPPPGPWQQSAPPWRWCSACAPRSGLSALCLHVLSRSGYVWGKSSSEQCNVDIGYVLRKKVQWKQCNAWYCASNIAQQQYLILGGKDDAILPFCCCSVTVKVYLTSLLWSESECWSYLSVVLSREDVASSKIIRLGFLWG